jgi:hypothetical protein
MAGMTTPTNPMHFPGPRDGLDEGSLAELAQDGREIAADVVADSDPASPASPEQEARPSLTSTSGPIDVPEGACALIDGLAAYGA